MNFPLGCFLLFLSPLSSVLLFLVSLFSTFLKLFNSRLLFPAEYMAVLSFIASVLVNANQKASRVEQRSPRGR